MSIPTCPSCGIAYTDHLGLHGTCAEVQRLRAEVAALQAQVRACEAVLDQLHDRGDRARADARQMGGRLEAQGRAAAYEDAARLLGAALAHERRGGNRRSECEP